MDSTCTNHPLVPAKRKCFYCKRFFCKNCLFLRDHHSFCSESCYQEHAQLLAASFKTAPPALPPLKKSTFSFPFSFGMPVIIACSILFGGIVGSFLTLVIMNWRFEERLSLLEKKQKGLQTASQRQWESFLKSAPSGSPASKFAAPDISIPRISARGISFSSQRTFSFDRGNLLEKKVALTFDGGAYANMAEEILAVLASRNIKATFFICGTFISQYPEIVRKISDQGHEVGNHTYSHLHLTTYFLDKTQSTVSDVSAVRLGNELKKADDLFYRLIGKHMSPIWRAPYGDYNETLGRWGNEAGFRHIGWTSYGTWDTNLDTNDWIPDESTPGYKSPGEVIRKILSFGEHTPYGANGGIILLHLGTVRKIPEQQVHKHLGDLIDAMRAKGYSFVTVGELLLQDEKPHL